MRCAAVARWRSGAVHRAAGPEPSESGTAPTRDWATANLHLPLTLVDLAGHARMSGRTFARRFRDEVGISRSPEIVALTNR